MVNLTDEQKELFYTGGNFKDYVFYFPEIGLKITNETIHQEAVTIKESICEEQEFTLGGCVASQIEFDVSEIIQKELAGLGFSATLYVNLKDDGTYDLKMPMGVYRVESAKMVDDKDYKHVVAYDALYDASVDVSGWYNDLFSQSGKTVTLKQIRESLLEFLGLSYVRQNLINDNILISKTVEPSEGSLTGTALLKQICTVNGGFGRINRDGLFEVIGVHGLGLFPEDSKGEDGNVYPEETLFPEDHFLYMGISEDGSYPEYRETKFEEYMCPAPSCVTIQSNKEDYGITSGNNTDNPYLITGNILLFDKTAEQLREIGGNILKRIEDVTYRPNTTKLYGLPYMEAGDVFALEKRTEGVESYIFSRTLSGVQNLIDNYESKGSIIRENNVSQNTEIIQLKGKTLILKKSIDGVSSELTDFEEKTSSRFEQTDKSISAEVKRAEGTEEEISGRIDVTEGQVVLKVDSAGNMAEVSLGVDADNPSATKFLVSAKNIELTAEEVISLMTGGTMNLTGKNIKIDSENFSVSENGEVVANSIEITGGSVMIETKAEGDNFIVLKNLNFLNDEDISDVNAYGEGSPTNYGKPGDVYLNLLTGEKYAWTGPSHGWAFLKRIDVSEIEWQTNRIDSENGFSCEKRRNYPGSVDGLTVSKSAYLNKGDIYFRREYIGIIDGFARQMSNEGHIYLLPVEDAVTGKYESALKSDVPFYAPNIYNLDTTEISLISYLNSAGNFSAYSGQSVRLFCSGNVVEISGAITPKRNMEASADAIEILQLPDGYAPKAVIDSLQQSSGKHTWLLKISTNGNMTFSRYGIGGYEVATNGIWLPIHVTYLI